MELRLDEIAEILRVFADSELEELRLEIGGTRLHVSKRSGGGSLETASFGTATTAPREVPAASLGGGVPETAGGGVTVPGDGGRAATAGAGTPASEAPASTARAAEEAGWIDVRSPLLGVFYRRPAPDQPPFVDVGSAVGADDPVCIIDVMKMFTRVPAGAAGRIVEIVAEDGKLVEHGQVIMRIAPQ